MPTSALSNVKRQVRTTCTASSSSNVCTNTHRFWISSRNTKEESSSIVEEYLAYTNHVSKASYDDIETWKAHRLKREADWPEYAGILELISKPAYISSDSWKYAADRRAPTQEEYAKQYRVGAQRIQERRQHHVHIPDEEGNRKPLTHCKRKDDPMKCKANFPKTGELCLTQAAVICKGLAAKCDLPVKGARNALGCLKARRNDEWQNASNTALLVALRCNSDVKSTT